MDIDLRSLPSLKQISINELLVIPESYYEKMDIIRMDPVQVKGSVYINIADEIELDLELKGEFILPCAISLEPVSYPFRSQINVKLEENHQEHELKLALLDILWENIVLEVPIKVVKPGLETKTIKGEGWELES